MRKTTPLLFIIFLMASSWLFSYTNTVKNRTAFKLHVQISYALCFSSNFVIAPNETKTIDAKG